MENRINLEAVRGYFGTRRRADFHSETSAQCVEKAPYSAEKKLDANLSSEFTELIRQAARCNRYASDLIYGIEDINEKMETWTGEKTLFVFGFRRDGVDGNSFVLSRVNNECKSVYDLHKLYFAIYFMEVKEDEEYTSFYKVETNGYYL